MTIEIKKKNPISHSIKVAVLTISVFIIAALVSKIIRQSESDHIQSKISLQNILSTESTKTIPTIYLDVINKEKESSWSNAFSEIIGGKTEVKVKNGRVDIITDKFAIEVDFLHKWKEGLGQALYYGSQTDLIPVLALISKEAMDSELLETINSFCKSKGVEVILLDSK